MKLVRAVVGLAALAIVLSLAPAALAVEAAQMPPPAVDVQLNGKLSQKVIPLRVSWPAAPATSAAVSRYTLERQEGSGTWISVPLPSALSQAVVIRLPAWRVHTFRVQATYADASTTSWGVSEPLWLAHADESDLAIAYQPAWALKTGIKAFGGARRTSSLAGATATYTFRGTDVAWISARGPKLGRARIYIDGDYIRTVDLRTARSQPRRVAFEAHFETAETRTLRVEVEGTAGRPRVDVDGFITLAAPASATIVGAGDIGRCGAAGVGQTAALIEALGVATTVYTTGDNAYPSGTAEEFANCYDPYWGTFKSRTRPSPGNHDYVYGGGAYFDYFGANAGPAGRGYYAYEAGTWRVYSLNSETCRQSNSWCAPGSAQYEWLRADLLAQPHQCVIAYWHRPLFSSGSHGGSTRMLSLTTLLYQMGADVVLGGHDHGYERFVPMNPSGDADADGIHHFVVGTGGAALYAYDKPAMDTTVVRQAVTHGVLRFDLGLGTYGWEYLPTQAGAFTDSGSGTCH